MSEDETREADAGVAGGTAERRASVPGETGQADSSEVDAQAFAQATRKGGTQAGLAGGEGDLGGGGDLAGDYGALDAEGDEGRPA